MASVNWTEPALAALDGIHDYLSREAPFYASHITEQILSAVDRCSNTPSAGDSCRKRSTTTSAK